MDMTPQSLVEGLYLYNITTHSLEDGQILTDAPTEDVLDAIIQWQNEAPSVDAYYEQIGEKLVYHLYLKGYSATWIVIQTTINATYNQIQEVF